MQLKLDAKFKDNLRGRFGKYDFQVGILKDGLHRDPKRGVRGQGGKDVISSYAGGPVRKASTQSNGAKISEVSASNRKRLGFNYLTAPFKVRSSDIVKFMGEFFKLAFGRSQKKRAENLLQAVVRNPILRGDYGSNSSLTQRIKGFDRNMIDTAQLFKSITASCRVRRSG